MKTVSLALAILTGILGCGGLYGIAFAKSNAPVVLLSGDDAAAALTGHSFKTDANTIWSFGDDGTQNSFSLFRNVKQWVAEGTWRQRSDLIC